MSSGRLACHCDRHVTVNNGEVILVCGRPGDRGDCTETPAALVPRHNVHKAWERERPGTPVILNLVVVYYCST